MPEGNMSRKREVEARKENDNKKESHIRSGGFERKKVIEKGVKTRTMSRALNHQKHTAVASHEGGKWTSFEITHLRRAVTFIPEGHPEFWELVQQMVMTKTKEECQERHQKDLKAGKGISYLSKHTKKRKFPNVHVLPVEDSNKCREEQYKCDGTDVSRTSQITYKCQVCDEGFTQKRNMHFHLLTHTTKRPCKCDICGREFNGKSRRCKYVHKHDTKKCRFCGKVFKTNSDMKVHLRIHTGEQPHRCSICGKRFNVKMDLQRHYRVHKGEKPFTCDVCGKGFSDKRDVKKHLTAHSRGERYACDICGKSFSRKSTLVIHIRIHSGYKPYSCDVCNKKFSSKGDKQKHVRIHTRIKPYKCESCGKMYTRKYSLNVHLRIHTSVKPYICEECGKTFIYRNSFRRHLFTHREDNNSKYVCNEREPRHRRTPYVCSKENTRQCVAFKERISRRIDFQKHRNV